jgi:hypothetical protein
VVFYRARLVNTSNNAVVVACQMSTHATSARNHFASNVYMTGTVGPVMIFQTLYVSSVSMTGRIILSCTARDTRPIFVECVCRDVNVCGMCHGQKRNVCCRVLQLVELLQHDGVRRMRDSSRMRRMCQEVL